MQFAFYYSTQGCDLLYKASSFLDNKMHKYVWTCIAKLLFINERKQDQLFDLNILESFVKFMHIWDQLGFFAWLKNTKVFVPRLIFYCSQYLLLTEWKSKNFHVFSSYDHYKLIVYITSIKCYWEFPCK